MAFSGVTSMTGCWRFFAIEPKEGMQKKQAENRVALRCLALFASGKVGSGFYQCPLSRLPLCRSGRPHGGHRVWDPAGAQLIPQAIRS
jgi:hypothetical protein